MLVSAKGDDTIYITLKNLEHIKEIHIWRAKCRNPDLGTRNYIPPGFYDQIMAASKKCADLRYKDPEIKTEMQFNEHDIEVLTKSKGTGEPYRSIDLKSFMGVTPLPLFDHSRKWISKPDWPPRRKILYDRDTEESLP